MQIHEDSKVQHTSSNGLQRPAHDTCFRVTGFADYSATAKAGTLKADGGDAGGGCLFYREGSEMYASIRNKSPTLESAMGDGGLNVPIVLAAFEGNGTRPSHKGSGINDGRKMFTLNSTEVHGVVCKN